MEGSKHFKFFGFDPERSPLKQISAPTKTHEHEQFRIFFDFEI